MDTVLLVAAALLLLAVDWLAFHDLGEPHSLRDWLVLLASLLVFVRLGTDLWKRYGEIR